MGTHQSLDKDIILDITADARKKGKSRFRWMNIDCVTGFSVKDIKHIVEIEKELALTSYQRSQEVIPLI